MRMKDSSEIEEARIDLTPMIDTVMFLLIFFMVTTVLGRKESDLGIQLPGLVKQYQTLKMPDEQIIEVTAAGLVILNGRSYDPPESRDMPRLVQTLARFRAASQAANTRALVTVQADDNTIQQRVIDVLNACAAAGISGVTFGMGEG